MFKGLVTKEKLNQIHILNLRNLCGPRIYKEDLNFDSFCPYILVLLSEVK